MKSKLRVAIAVSAMFAGSAAAAPPAPPHPPSAVTVKVPTQPIPGSRQARFQLVGDIANPRFTRLYVFDLKLQKFVDRYYTSPGSAKYPTQGSRFIIQRAIFRPTWTPPNATWAAGLQPQGPGLDNPMGLLKLDLGAYGQFIHGIPKGEEPALGTAASHGCLRMSTPNVLQLFQRYAGVGTKVILNRDPAATKRWAASFNAAGMQSHAITDGSELVDGVLQGGTPPVMEYH